MLQELEYFLELSKVENFERIMDRVAIRIAKCMASDHFQVAQRTLLLWENDSLANVLFKFRERIFPKIFVSLQKATDHWNEGVSELALCVLNMFLELEPELFTKCIEEVKQAQLSKEASLRRRGENWELLMKSVSYERSFNATNNQGSVSSPKQERKACVKKVFRPFVVSDGKLPSITV
mmetsp:Transcript_46422/g.74645  ORF Transcript_46422/g.74645 Transcript_46422/m.74645 type:complete len:179 (+) Transcript_46422:1050-1586(+)